MDREDIANKKQLHILQYIYDDYEKLKNDFYYTRDLYEKLLPKIGKILCNEHNLNWDPRSMKIFFGSWLHTYLPMIRERYQTILKALEENPEDIFILANNELKVYSSEDFKKKINEDEYNHFLYSKILKFINIDRYNKSYFITLDKNNLPEKNYLDSLKIPIKNFFLSSLQIFLNFLTKNSKGVLDRSYFSLKHFIKIVLLSFPLVSPLIYLPNLQSNYKKTTNRKLRDKCTSKLKKVHSAENHFENFLLENLFKDLPLDFLENFNQVLEASNYIDIKNKNFLSANGILFNQILQCAVANQLSLNKNLIIAQHGGSYGIVCWSMQEFYELDVADKFISFGWLYKNHKKIRGLSNPKLLLNFKEKKIIKNKILYITWGPSRFFNRNWSNPIAGNSIRDYFNNINNFIKNTKSIRNHIYVRLSPSNFEYKVGIEDFLENTVKYADGDFYKEIESSSLVICDHNQTTFLESLSNNKPTIIVWNEEFTKINDDAALYFGYLKEVGIFYSNHIEAANFVKDLVINKSIDAWWLDNKRQKVVKTFINKYAKRNLNWIQDYQNILS